MEGTLLVLEIQWGLGCRPCDQVLRALSSQEMERRHSNQNGSDLQSQVPNPQAASPGLSDLSLFS